MAKKGRYFQESIERKIENLKKNFEAALSKARDDTYADFFAVVEKKVHDMFDDVVRDFYSDYSPYYYDRNYSLFNILQTKATRDSVSIWFDPEKMTPFRSGYRGEDGLYEQVFRLGWHGGAASGKGHPEPGIPYWRTPVPYYTNWKEYDADVAPRSPRDEIFRRVKDYENFQMDRDFDMIWRIRVRGIEIKWGD